MSANLRPSLDRPRTAAAIRRGKSQGTDHEGYLLVSFRRSDRVRRCEVLFQSRHQAPPPVGANVLVLESDDPDELPVVLGWTDTFAPLESATSVGGADEAVLPDELVIEARKNLTLRVGEGSITIRADGKILIKGKDLVSHAQRTNRIKGGSVAIN